MTPHTRHRTFRSGLGPILLSLLLSACGGGGGGGGGDGTGDGSGGLSGDGTGGSGSSGIPGDWTVVSEVNGTQCGEGTYTETQSLDIEQSGSSLTVTDSDGNVFSGSVDGRDVSWSGSFTEDGGTTRLDLSATLDADGNGFAGSSSFTFRSDDGSINCNGTTTFEGTRVSGGGSGGGDGAVTGGSGDVVLGALAGDWPFYLGGTEDDFGSAVAVDSAGNIVVSGLAGSETFSWPGTDDLRSAFGVFRNTYVIKYSSGGTPLWATMIDTGAFVIGIATDDADNVFVQGGSTVTKLSADGERLWTVDFSDDWGPAPFAKFSGNASLEHITRSRIAVNTIGEVIVSGTTAERGAAAGGFQTSMQSNREAVFVAKLSADGNHLWSTYLGADSGRHHDAGITIGSAGTIFVTGTTNDVGWPASAVDDNMPADVTSIEGQTCFVAALSTAGEFAWSTFIGGGMADNPTTSNGRIVLNDRCTAIEHDRSGTLTVTGSTSSLGDANGGWTSGGYQTQPSTFSLANDGFVLQMPDTGTSITWSTYFGAIDGGTDEGLAIASRGVPGTYIAGLTESQGWASNARDSFYNRGRDGFLLKLSGSGDFEFATYLGGRDADEARGLALDLAGNPIVTGFTDSSIWTPGDPDLINGTDGDYQGGIDAFIVRQLPD